MMQEAIGYKKIVELDFIPQEECIPVGCVPAARRSYAGVCFRGVYLVPGGHIVPGGVLSPGGCT